MDDRRRAQEQREWASRQRQKKKDEIHSAKGPLFGPPVKIEQRNDPLAKRIHDVLGDASVIRKENNLSSSALIGVERTPQTPGVIPKSSKEIFSSSVSDKKNESVKSKDRSRGSSKEHRRSRSVSTDKSDKCLFEKPAPLLGSSSQNTDKPLAYKGKRSSSPVSSQSGQKSMKEVESGKPVESRRNSSSKSSSNSSSSRREKSQPRHSSESERSLKSSAKCGLNPPGNAVHDFQSPPNGLLPLKIPPEKRSSNGENIDVIFGEVAIKPPLTAIQTPRKEEPSFPKLLETKTPTKKSYKGDMAGSIRRVSSGGLGIDLLVSSDSEAEGNQEPVQETTPPVQGDKPESIPSKRESSKKNSKSRVSGGASSSVGKMSLSESSDSSDDSEEESESPSGSDSSSSEEEEEEKAEEEKSPQSQNHQHPKDTSGGGGSLNVSKADSEGSAGSVGLFDVTGDTPAEKRKKSFNIERIKKELMNDTGNSSLDVTPTKEAVSPSEFSPEKPEDKNFNEGVDKCFEMLQCTPSKSHFDGVEDTSSSAAGESWKHSSAGSEVTSTSNQSGSGTKSSSKSNNGSLRNPIIFGIASSVTEEDRKPPVVESDKTTNELPSLDNGLDTVVREVPKKSSGSSKSSGKVKHSSSSEIIPDNETKKSSSNTTKSTKSKSKRPQSEAGSNKNNSISSKSNLGSLSSLKEKTQSNSAAAIISESPVQFANKKSKLSNSASNVGVNSSTPKTQIRGGPPKGTSKAWITSSDASSDEEEGELRNTSVVVDVEGLSSPDKPSKVVLSSVSKESTPVLTTAPSAVRRISELGTPGSASGKSVLLLTETKDISNNKSKAKHRPRHNSKSSSHPAKLSKLVSKNSTLDLNHIFGDVIAPDELLSPVPSMPNLQPKRTKEVRKSLTKPAASSSSLLSKEDGLLANNKEAEAAMADSTVTPLRGGNCAGTFMEHDSQCLPEGLQVVNDTPSIVVSIDLRLVNLPSSKTIVNNSHDVDRKSGGPSSSNNKSSTSGTNRTSYQQQFVKEEGNIFQNLSRHFPLDSDLIEDAMSQHSSATTPDVPPSVPTFHIAPEPCDEEDDNHISVGMDTKSNNTNRASRQSTAYNRDNTTEVAVTPQTRPKKQEPVDVSTIIDLEGLRPPATKIPLKRRQGDSSSLERSKKPRTEERVCRDNKGASPLESPHWNHRMSDYDRRGSRERLYKKSRLDNNASHHIDECSRSPSVRESPGWSVHGSDYRRTPWNEEYSDRESVHHDEDHWDHKGGEGRSEHADHTMSSHSRAGGGDSKHTSFYERDKWRERRERERHRERKNRKYSRDWDAPGDDPLADSHYDSGRSPGYVPYSGRVGVGSQWGAMAADSSYSESSRERHHRGAQYDRGGGYDSRPPREHRRTVPPVNHKLESADLYLEEAKKLKHRADKIQDKTEKMLVYVDAFLSFIQCGYAMENENISAQAKICRMYHDTLKLIKYYVVGQESTDKSDVNKKLTVFSFRIQSVLHFRLYKLKKNDTAKLKRIIDDHNKSVNTRPGVQAPSPYNSSQTMSSTTQSSSNGGGSGGGWKGTSGTPSPMSPQPSPAGSVGSVGSVGSGDHPKMVNGNVSSTTVCVPQRIHSVTQEYLKNMELLYLCNERWDMADTYMDDKDYFSSLDRDCGCLTLQSSVPELVRYIKEGLSRLRGT